FGVQVAKGAPNGPYSVYAIDGAGRSAIAEFKVGATASPTVPTLPKDDGKLTKRRTVPPLPKDDGKTAELKRIQKALCVNPDGIFVEKSARALRDYQLATRKTVDGKLTESLKKELLELPDTEIEKRCKRTTTTTAVAEQVKSLASSLKYVRFNPSEDPNTTIVVEKAVSDGEMLTVTLIIPLPQGGGATRLTQVGVKQDLLSTGKQLGANVDGLGVNNITITNLDALVQAGLLQR